ncbi:MAG TPA: DUF6491 family protein [Azospirillaceae bacterium]|nr:DUF6491 family protein [Azospirillaceae bacterium]
MHRALLAAALAALLSLPAAAETPKDRTCFRADNINGWTYVDRDTVRITVGVREQYELTLFSPQPELAFRYGVGVRTRGSSWVCSPLDLEIIGDRFEGAVHVKAMRRVEDRPAPADKPAG